MTWIKKIFFGIFIIMLFLPLQNIFAENSARSFRYQSIDFDFKVNTYSTIDVIETETFNFIGDYHQGWRTLSLNKLDDITDFRIFDGETGAALAYSSRRLDKSESSSWNKYTVFSKNNSKNIEWYYDAKDTTRTWILHYKIHGAIGFFDDHDEFYYNLFTEMSAPVSSVTANVTLPKDSALTIFSAYRGNSKESIFGFKSDNKSFVFTFNNVGANEPITIAPSWDKGIIKKIDYWKDFAKIHFGFIFAIFIILLSLIIIFVRWYLFERLPMSKMTVIPQYEPPEHLPPVMAEIIMKGKVTRHGWPATIVDLAVRGYITIEEEKIGWKRKLFNSKYTLTIIFTVFILFLILFGLIQDRAYILILPLFATSLIIVAYFLIISGGNKNYILKLISDNTEGLQDYEKKYLRAIFSKNPKAFSTFDTKNDSTASYNLYKKIEKIMSELESNNTAQKYYVKFKTFPKIAYLLLLPLILFQVIFELGISLNIMALLLGMFASGAVIYLGFTNPRLNETGRILKADWLGFKMYLETAERYRMQNLTPDMFEKYLPYAMIFGVEKKWAKAFSGMNLSQPNWYIGPATTYGFFSRNASAFSATSFVSSFSASFSSTFSNAGAGGAGGGSGGAGGGGGGGGGGAS